MSWLKKLFSAGGGSDSEVGTGTDAPEEVHRGFVIRASLLPSGSEYQLSGTIEKRIDGVLKRRDFTTGDRFATKHEAVAATLAEGRRLVDDKGEAIFA